MRGEWGKGEEKGKKEGGQRDWTTIYLHHWEEGDDD